MTFRGILELKSRVVVALGPALVACACEASRSPRSDEMDQTAPQRVAADYPIVFTSDRDSPGIRDLYVLSADGAATRKITEGGDFWLPRWSPDGSSIVFRQVVEGLHAEVGVLSPDVSGLVLLTDGEDAQQWLHPANWSADGSEVAFASLGPSTNVQNVRLWVISKTGSQLRRVFPELEVPQMELVWSLPDGTRRVHSEGSTSAAKGLWLDDASSGDPITSLAAGRVYAPSHLAWSPDGTRLAFSGYPLDAEGHFENMADHTMTGTMPPDDEIFVIDVESAELIRVTDNDALDFAPAWTPDGKGLIFSSDRDGDDDLWLVSLDAPDEARNLIDDNADPHSDSLGHWYLGLR